MRAIREPGKRIVVEMPPRHGKSELTSRYFPAWCLGRYPDRHIISVSATKRLSENFSYAARETLRQWGPRLFGVHLARDRQSLATWRTTAGGQFYSTSVGGSILGEGAHVLVIDDYFKAAIDAESQHVRDELFKWYLTGAKSRLMDNGSVIMVATRWHEDDLIGKSLKLAEKTGEKWEVIRYPAIANGPDDLGREAGDPLWPLKFPIERLEELRIGLHESGYPEYWAAMYQQEPISGLGAEFDPAWFGPDAFFDEWPDPSEIAYKFQALDPSLGESDKSDYSAIVTLMITRDGKGYVDADICRRNTQKMVSDAFALWAHFRSDSFGIESNGFQRLLADEIIRTSKAAGFMIPAAEIYNYGIAGRGKDQKKTRIRRLTPYLAKGELKFKKGSPGVGLLIDQLKNFPNAEHDDGPDALEMAVRLAREFIVSGWGHDQGPESVVERRAA